MSDDNHSVLTISEVLVGHSGVYTCRAENVAGSVTCTASLNVLPETKWDRAIELESPWFVKKLSPVRVMDGECATLMCQVNFILIGMLMVGGYCANLYNTP